MKKAVVCGDVVFGNKKSVYESLYSLNDTKMQYRVSVRQRNRPPGVTALKGSKATP